MRFFVIWPILYLSIRYYNIVVTAVAHRFFNRAKWKSRKINLSDTPWQEELKKAKKGMVLGSVIRTGMVAALFSLPDGSLPFYFDISDRGWFYFFASIIVYTLYFDLWFYISHRFIFHNRNLYKHSHLTHHRFRDPVIPVRNAFSTSELVIIALGGFGIVFIMPIHPAALIIGRELIVPLINTYNHMGYEIMPKGFTRHFLFKYLTTPTHHTLHHMHNNGNYSLLINYDFIFNTQFKNYHDFFEAIHDRPKTEIDNAQDHALSKVEKNVS